MAVPNAAILACCTDALPPRHFYLTIAAFLPHHGGTTVASLSAELSIICVDIDPWLGMQVLKSHSSTCTKADPPNLNP